MKKQFPKLYRRPGYDGKVPAKPDRVHFFRSEAFTAAVIERLIDDQDVIGQLAVFRTGLKGVVK